MKFYKFLINTVFIFGFSTNFFSQYIQVNDTYTPQQLVENVLVNSPCANVSNFSASGDTFTPGFQSYGYFTKGTSNFPFANGIVLSTSSAKRTEGPNDNLIDEGQQAWGKDVDLEQTFGFSNETYNATVLEFDFVPLTSTISFDYLFASEEYQGTAPCRYSDAFAFLLKPIGATTPYQNLALIPGTNSPVLVTSVHPQIQSNNGNIACQAENEAFFDQYNPTNAPINLNGQTKVLTASANVVPGTPYHIKLVIADHENIRYDSAIFLAGGSFKIGTNLGSDKLIANQNPLCQGETLLLDATQTAAISYKWFQNGNPILDIISGLPITTPTYQVTAAGTYKVEVIINASCTSTDEIVIEYATTPTVFDTVLVQCDANNDGISIFDLSKVKSIITGNDNQLTVVNYYKNLPDATNAVSEITNPTTFSNSISNVVYVRIKNNFGCVAIAKIDLQISNHSINPLSKDFCDNSGVQDGVTQFTQLDFNSITNDILISLPSGLIVTYYLNYADDLSQMTPILFPFTNTTALLQIIYARVVNGSDCYGVVPITLKINTFSPSNFETEIVGICSGIPKIISVAGGFSSYVWTPANPTATNQISVSKEGIYAVEVTNSSGCKATKEFQVEASESATIQNIVIDDFNENSNTVLINYSGNGVYEFSLDGIHFQDSPYFTDVLEGEYTIVINGWIQLINANS